MKKFGQILLIGALTVGIFSGVHTVTRAQSAPKKSASPATYFSPTITKRSTTFPAKSIKLYGRTYKLVRYKKTGQLYLGYYQ